ncbi:TRAP transporter substrate-binding protein [Rhizobium alvei]|uniref:TRAP transporter substrate-binding protein n=1 Tax=Rhizobium alvei TaxID=1132659 RepID=A0ABT8YTI8_9HYPH|nr:TRAP transporter substrate-binding protein [Rhizobium alvei]MDO6966669.1 TRAP transporter substrate-binding protein [Rhizobium alvei]
MLKTIMSTLAATLLLTLPVSAREMRVSSHEPQQGFYSSKILQAWIDKINPKLSEGNQFKLYPGAILGAPPAQAELVKNGVADVALVVPTYTPGVFPLSGVVEVPGIASTSIVGTQILNTLADEGALEKEYGEYKIIALFTTPSYRFLMAGDGIRKPGDLKGMKLRTPSQFGSTLFGLLGASGVTIPAPQVYENLERGVVSGAVWVMDAYKTFRLDEVAPSITTVRFTAQPMAILMNKATYESLPEADRKVLDEMSGRTNAEWVASVVDAADASIEADFRSGGKAKFIELTDAEKAEWDAALAGAADAWVAAQSDAEAAAKALATARKIAGQ